MLTVVSCEKLKDLRPGVNLGNSEETEEEALVQHHLHFFLLTIFVR